MRKEAKQVPCQEFLVLMILLLSRVYDENNYDQDCILLSNRLKKGDIQKLKFSEAKRVF